LPQPGGSSRHRSIEPRPARNGDRRPVGLVRPHRAEFDEPDIRELRDLVESAEKLGPDTIINQALVRELKTRGREIVDAWDAWQAARQRAKEAGGLPELNRRGKEINERRRRLWSRIAETPARTADGMHAKIAFASSFNLLERGDLVEGTVDDLIGRYGLRRPFRQGGAHMNALATAEAASVRRVRAALEAIASGTLPCRPHR
jgi:hypothetical protein